MKIKLLLGTALALGLIAAPANAALQFGDATFDQASSVNNQPTGVPAGGTTWVQRDQGTGPSYVAPIPGVITSVAFVGQQQTGIPALYRVQTFRPVSLTSAITQGSTSFVVTTPGAQVVQVDARIPVLAGDLLGLNAATEGSAIYYRNVATYGISSTNSAFQPGQSFSLSGATPSRRILVSARIEPDSDSDGFGDETQDGCVGTAGRCFGVPPQGLCKVPKLAKSTYASATTKTVAAGCKISRSGSKSKKAKVSTQAIPAGTTVLGGTTVKVKMKLKKKAKKK